MEMELEESIKLAVEGCGVDLYDIVTTKENNKNILRIYITSKGGVNLEKCTEVSRMVSPVLDIHEPFHGEYNLEVSSPGVERKLKTLHHFQSSIGDKVKIKEYSNNVIKGELLEVTNEGEITIKDKDNNEVKTTFNEVLAASTYFEW